MIRYRTLLSKHQETVQARLTAAHAPNPVRFLQANISQGQRQISSKRIWIGEDINHHSQRRLKFVPPIKPRANHRR